MANEEHLKWLREGVEALNKRRKKNTFQPDLRGEELSAANLSGANLAEANVIGADLSGAGLTGASLVYANLADTNLTDAILTGANLSGAILSNANLTGTNLIRAILARAILTNANTNGAQLSRTYLRWAIVRTVYSATSTDDESAAEYTNMSKTSGLTQIQLDSMIGDSGTIIPHHLTRPKHWEVLPWHLEDAGQGAQEPTDTFEDAPKPTHAEKPREYYQELALNLNREPIKSAEVLGAYGQQLLDSTRLYRRVNKFNELPYDLILVEQIGQMFGALSTTIQKQQTDSADTIAGLETKIAELEKQLYQLKGELNAVKNSQSEKTPKESGFISTVSTNFAKGFGVTLGTGVAVGILAGATYIFGDGQDIAQKLVDAFNGLFRGPADPKVVPPQDSFDA